MPWYAMICHDIWTHLNTRQIEAISAVMNLALIWCDLRLATSFTLVKWTQRESWRVGDNVTIKVRKERERDTSTHTHIYIIIYCFFLLITLCDFMIHWTLLHTIHTYIFIPWAGGLHPAFAGGKEPHCNPHPELRVAASSGRKGGSERFPGHRGQAALWLLSWQACRSEGTEENRGDLQRHDPQVLCGALPRCGPRYCEGHHRSQSLSMSQHVSACLSMSQCWDFQIFPRGYSIL